MMNSRRRLGGLVFLAALALLTTSKLATVRGHDDEDCDRGDGWGWEHDELVLAFSTMVENPGNVAINDVPSATVAWTIDDCDGVLLSDGTVRIRVRGLVLSSDGSNPNVTFQAIVTCTTVNSFGDVVSDSVSTGEFTATASGHCHIHDTVTLPSPCIAPIVLIADPNGNWLAATGM